jgi:hypothetical protein
MGPMGPIGISFITPILPGAFATVFEFVFVKMVDKITIFIDTRVA